MTSRREPRRRQQGPRSSQTAAVPGCSLRVHHLACQVRALKETRLPWVYVLVGSHTGAVHGAGGRLVGTHVPWSTQTWALPGVSPWVHHCAFQVWPLDETESPPLYCLAASQAGAVAGAGL